MSRAFESVGDGRVAGTSNLMCTRPAFESARLLDGIAFYRPGGDP